MRIKEKSNDNVISDRSIRDKKDKRFVHTE